MELILLLVAHVYQNWLRRNIQIGSYSTPYARERAGTEVARRFDDFEGSITYAESWDQRRVELPVQPAVWSSHTLSPAKDLGSVVEYPRFFPLKEVLSFLLTPAGKGYGAI